MPLHLSSLLVQEHRQLEWKIQLTLRQRKKRLARLNTLWNKYALEKNKAYEGKVVKVLVDGFSKKDDHVYSGYTDTNKLVNFTGENIQPGDFVDVLIETGKTFSLDGRVV